MKWSRVAGLLLLGYGVLFFLSRLVHWILFDVAGIEGRLLAQHETFVVALVVPAAAFIFAVDSAVAGRILRPDPRRLLTFMAATLFLGVAIEISLDGAAVSLLGRKAWEYRVWPLHDGYTSGVAAFMWPLYGAHLCLLEDALEARGRLPETQLSRSMLGGFDAMLMELVCNTWAIATFGTYYFYYLAPDLKNFTAAEIYVPYVFANLLLAATVRRLDRAGGSWWIWCAGLLVGALALLFFP